MKCVWCNKELEKWNEKSSFWQISITLARTNFRPFATPTLGTAALEERVRMLRMKLFYSSLCLVQVYGPNFNVLYSESEFEDKTNDALRMFNTVLSNPRCFRETSMHTLGNDTGYGREWLQIGRHGDADGNNNGRFLLQLSCSNALCVINTFDQHRNLHKYSWCRDSLGQRPLIYFCRISANDFQILLYFRVKNSVALSTDHCPVVCKLGHEKTTGPRPGDSNTRAACGREGILCGSQCFLEFSNN